MTVTTTLTVTTPSDREIAMSRQFDAPRQLVFNAYTDPNLVQRWLTGPAGWSMVVCEIDPRVGGAYRYEWRHEDGRTMGMGGVFRELVAPERIVSTERFDDPWYEGEAIGTITFEERNGKTTLTATIRYATKETRDSVLKSGMTRGVDESYDHLATLLASSNAH